MAEPRNFEGATHHYGPARGEEERQGHLHVLKNGFQAVSAWVFTKEELQRMLDSDQTAYLSVWYGDGDPNRQPVFPVFIGNKTEMNQILLDFGKEVIK